MAIPQITNNSPVAGSFSWSAFGMSFLNVNQGIAAGSSSKKFVWWRYGNGNPYLEEGDVLPGNLDDTNDCVLFINKNGVAACVLNTQLVDGSLVVDGSIMAAAISANQIDTYHIKANAVTADQIAANSISAADIQAGAITTDKLAVGSVSDSLVANGSFEETDANFWAPGWQAYVTPANGTLAVVEGIATSGKNAMRLAATTTAANVRVGQTPDKYMPVTAISGRKWYVSMRYGGGAVTTSGLYFRVSWYDAAKVLLSSTDVLANAAIPNSFTVAESQVTPPANAKYMGLSVLLVNPSAVVNLYVDELVAREVIVSAIIGDGQITTAKMTANSINADRLSAGTITATQLAANSITADKMIVSDFTNYAQDGSFQDTAKRSWTGSGTIVTSTTEPNKLKVVTAASGNNDQSNVYMFNVTPGESYYGEMEVYGETTNVGGGGPNLHLTVTNDAGSPSWPTFQSTTRAAVQGQWVKLAGIVTIPSGARRAKVEPAVGFASDAVGNIYYFRKIQVRRMSAGELIVDGSIIAAKIDTDAVTATKIKAGEIGTNHMTANSINADRILANTIAGDKILANQIKAGHILAGEIGTNHMVANTINGDRVIANTLHAAKIQAGTILADRIAAGTITGDRLAANTLTAKTLAVGDFTNLATINEVNGTTITSYGQTQIVGGYNSLVTDSGSFLMFCERSGPVPFKPGEQLLFKFTAKATAATTVQPSVWVYDAGSANATSVAAYQNVGTTDTPVTAVVTIGTPAFIPKEFVLGLGGVANKGIQVKDVTVRRIHAGEMIVDGGITAVKIKAGDINTNHMTANTINGDRLLANTITAAKIVANSIGTGQLTANGVNADRLVANSITATQIQTNAVTAGKILAGEIGTNHMTANTILGDRIAANSLAANKIQANSITANELQAGAITANKLESNLILTSRIVAGNPNSTHAEMSQEGFRVFADDPSDGIPNEVVRLGVASTNDYFAVTKADGSMAASISQDGVISGTTIYANDELVYKGDSISKLLADLPRGPLYKAELSSDVNGITTTYGLLTAEAVMDGTDRQIMVEAGINFYPAFDAAVEAYAELHYTYDGTAPTINSPVLVNIPLGKVSQDTYDTKQLRHTIRPTTMRPELGVAGAKLKILLCIVKGTGTKLNVVKGYNTYLYLTDMGKGIAHTPQFTPGGGSIAAPPPAAPPVQTYVKQWGCVNSANYDGNGNRYTYNDAQMYQGLSPAGYGNLKSLALFNDMTADLSGASINYIRVYFNFNHWYYNSGGTAIIGVHGNTGIPGTWNWAGGGTVTSSGGWPKPGARWVDIPSDQWNAFKTGQWRGVTLSGDGTYNTYGYADRPTIEISYTK